MIDPENLPAAVRAYFVAVGRYGASMREQVESTCAICGAPFTGLRTKRFCGDACRQAAKRARQRGGPTRHGGR